MCVLYYDVMMYVQEVTMLGSSTEWNIVNVGAGQQGPGEEGQ